MKLVYIAGPYRAESEWQVRQNIREAEQLALEVWRSGAACICPHKNTAGFGGAADDALWLKGDLEMLHRCDAVVCTGRWQSSRGARDEVAAARQRGIPVFQDIIAFQAWLVDADADSRAGASEPRSGSIA